MSTGTLIHHIARYRVSYSSNVFVFVFALFFAANAPAQLPTADLSRMEPRAVRAGESAAVNLYGSNLEDLAALQFTHPGIKAKPVMLPADEFWPEPRQDGTKFEVSVAADVPPGIYEARVSGYFGLSTARPFVVAPADSNEIVESGKNSSRETAMPIELNQVVTGSVASRGVDWFKFSAKADQRLIIDVVAERIDSRMDGLIVLFDAGGKEISRNRQRYGRDPFLELAPDQDGEFHLALSDILYRGSGDHYYRLSVTDRPHIDFIFPPMGQPGSTRKHKVFGRNLPGGSLSELVYLDGQQLESVEVEIEMPDEPRTPNAHHPGEPRQGMLRGVDFQLEDSNSYRVGFATAPIVAEDPGLESQTVSVPVEIAGRFEEPNDLDVFRFKARKGEEYWVEAISDRLAANSDPMVVVHKIALAEDESEKRIKVAENDDPASFFRVDGKDAINMDTADAAVGFTADADADYSVTILNQFGSGDAANLYRLAVRKPCHDFDLMATTERPLPTNRAGYSVTPLLRRNAKWGVRVFCPRRDGFQGDIVVSAEDLPEGVSAKPLTLSGKTDHGILVLAADAQARSWAGNIRIVGRAAIDGKNLIREARFASLVWGHIFSDSIRVRSRLAQLVPLGVNEREEAPVVIAPAEEKEWTVEIGQTLEIPIKVTDNGTRKGNLTIEPHSLFGMLRGQPTVNVPEGKGDGVLKISFRPTGNFKVEPGRYQFALHGTGVAKYRHNDPANVRTGADRRRIEKLADQFKAEAEKARAAAVAAKKALDQAKQNASTASEEAKADLQAKAKKAEVAHAEADKKATAAAEESKRAEKARAEIQRLAKTAAAKAVEKNEKFAAWSDLITVVVKPASKK